MSKCFICFNSKCTCKYRGYSGGISTLNKSDKGVQVSRPQPSNKNQKKETDYGPWLQGANERWLNSKERNCNGTHDRHQE